MKRHEAVTLRRELRGNSRRAFLSSLLAMPAAVRSASVAAPPIVTAPDASASELWAASELRAHLGGWTGTRIAVGGGDFAKQFGLSVSQEETCLARRAGDTLVIAGGGERGAMYGVFEFLDRLGFRWYTRDITYAPPAQRIEMRGFREIVRPAFGYREVFFTEAQEREWSARNRLNGNFHRLDAATGGRIGYRPFAHSFYDLVPPAEYFGSNPEYFALVSGRRRQRNAQLCLTNADIVPISRSRIQQWIAGQPDLSVVSVSQNDGGGWCECDECSRVVREEGGAMSGLLLRFVNRIAESFTLSNPQILFDTLAYQKTIDPPNVTRPRPNVQIRFCPIDACQAHSYGSCIFNRRFNERLTAWLRIAPRLVLWQYSINFSHFLLPFPNESAQSEDFRRFHAAGVSGVFVEGAVSEGGGGDNAELRSYIAARLLWNPKADVATETRGFLRAVYGDAAAAMAVYYKLRAREMRGQHLWIDQNIDAPYLTRSYLDDSRRALDRARVETTSATARRRIDHALLGLDYISVMRKKTGITEFFAHARELGVTHLREGYPIDAEERDLPAAQDATEIGRVLMNHGVTVEPAFARSYVDRGEPIGWRIVEHSTERLVLRAPGFEYERNSDRVRIAVRNTGGKPIPAALRLGIQIPLNYSKGERIIYTSRSGQEHELSIRSADAPEDRTVTFTGDDLPRDFFVAGQAGVRIDVRESSRCLIAWSFRETPRITVLIAGPEVEVAPGEQLTLSSGVTLVGGGGSE